MPITQAATAAYAKSVDVLNMPDRIRRLPISPAGFPVPWFVAWFKDGVNCPAGEGEPDFRVADTRKMATAMKQHVCWTCGQPMGAYKGFILGPMCAINRVISEPLSHRDCCIWSAKNCPFLSKPRMVRNEKDMPEGMVDAAGFGLKRNPGAVAVWITKSYRPFRPHAGNAGVLFSVGLPVEVLWFAEGRKATRAEVMASIESGYPTLQELARAEGPEALAALATQRTVAMALVPDR
jgi:hypothetical protein